jgi:hypothetical protein
MNIKANKIIIIQQHLDKLLIQWWNQIDKINKIKIKINYNLFEIIIHNIKINNKIK